MTLPISPNMSIDLLFLLATAAFGWGLSLATYRLFATRRGWPMGKLQSEAPAVPILIGLFAVIIAFLFAAARGAEFGGWWILVFGLLWSFFWTGLLRVAAQTALFFAPIATFLLIFTWASGRPLINFGTMSSDRLPASLQQPMPSPSMGLPGAPRPRVVETMRIDDRRPVQLPQSLPTQAPESLRIEDRTLPAQPTQPRVQ